METIGIIGYILGIYGGYMWIMEKKMETTITSQSRGHGNPKTLSPSSAPPLPTLSAKFRD